MIIRYSDHVTASKARNQASKIHHDNQPSISPYFNTMEHPAFTLAGLCAVGGTMGYVRKGSLPSLIGGTAVAILYGYSGYLLKNNADWGLELALGCSVTLFAAGLGRAIPTKFAKPIPLVLLGLGSVSSAFYAKKYNEFYPIF